MSPSSVELKLRPFSSSGKDHVGGDDPSVNDPYHIGPNEDQMRLSQQQQANSYHVPNTSNNKDW